MLLALLVSSAGAWATDVLELKINLTHATVTFYKSATEPKAEFVSNPGTAVTEADGGYWIVAHVVPEVGYWTDGKFLGGFEAVASLARTRGLGLDDFNKVTLLKRDTYTDTEGTHDRQDGAGWYYYQIPADHSFANGYRYSCLDGFVVPQFELYDTDKVSQNGKVVTVTDGTSDGWSADIEFNSVSWKFDGTISMPQATKITIKKGSSEQIVLDDETDIANQIKTGDVNTVKIGENDIQLGSASGYNMFIGWDSKSKFSILIPFDGSGTSTAPWKITNANELNLLAKCVNVGQHKFAGEYLEQTADIGMGSITDFQPIGVCGLSGSVFFMGSYNGAGKKISSINYTHPVPPEGFELDEVYAYVGLFGYNVGIITQVNLESSSFSVPAGTEALYVGGIAGLNEGLVSECTVSGCTIQSATNLSLVGGIAGRVNSVVPPIGSRAIGTRAPSDGPSATISGNRVRNTSITGNTAGAIFGVVNGTTNVLSDNLYDYNVEVTQGTTTNKAYTKRGINIITGGTADKPEYSLADIETNAGAMMEVYPVTFQDIASNFTSFTPTDAPLAVGNTAWYTKSNDTGHYFASGDEITVTVNVQTRYNSVADDGRTWHENLSSLTMNGGDNFLATKKFTMPYEEAKVLGAYSTADWFSIDTKEKEWMTYYQDWDNYDITDGAGTGKTIKVLTVSAVDLDKWTVTATDLEGVCYKGMPSLFYCQGGLPKKLIFTPTTKTTTRYQNICTCDSCQHRA